MCILNFFGNVVPPNKFLIIGIQYWYFEVFFGILTSLVSQTCMNDLKKRFMRTTLRVDVKIGGFIISESFVYIS